MTSTAAPDRWHGLDPDEARRRLAAQGPNALPEPQHRGLGRIVLGVLREPMFLLLVVAAAIYLVLGDLGEGLLLAAFALLSVGLVVLQERRSERALDALRAMAAPTARVRRGGQTLRIPAREVVPGDLLLVGEGERVAADALLRDAESLAADESALTGESVAVTKRAWVAAAPPPDAQPGGDDRPELYAGTLVVGGHGIAEVTATGAATQVGRIGVSIASLDPAPTRLERVSARLVRVFGGLGLAVTLAIVAWYGVVRGDWLGGVLAGIAIAMSMLPEEFPMVVAVFLALGTWRLSRVQVLARRPAVIETLGAATVLCVDKTGTLTENRLSVRRLVAFGDPAVSDGGAGEVLSGAAGDRGEEGEAGESRRDAPRWGSPLGGSRALDVVALGAAPLPEAVHRVLEVAALASRRGSVDPMDRAVTALADRLLDRTEHLHPDWSLAQEYALSSEQLSMSQVWGHGEDHLAVAAKGAPEAVVSLCHLPPEAAAAVSAQVQSLAAAGLRVVAVASGRAPALGPLPPRQHDFHFTLEGLVAFEDPLRARAADAVAAARGAGIAVAMITGDYPATALAIARDAGIPTEAGALTGEAIAALDDAALAEAVRRVRVFARVTPAQKLRLVQALQRNGEVVAMTGDGVNDAPALKAAHIGLAMGERGTDVAREAASIVLLREDLGRIVDGVRTGRRIFENLRKVMTYIVAVHVPIAGLALLPLLLGLPPLLLPVHVVLLEMLIDPACSFAFEAAAEDRDLMTRPPRPADDLIIGRGLLVGGVVQGVAVLAAALVAYALAVRAAMPEGEARALALSALLAGNVALVGVNLRGGWRLLATPGFVAVLGVSLAALVAGVAWPAAGRLLHVAMPPATMLLAAAGAAILLVVVVDAVRRRVRTPAR